MTLSHPSGIVSLPLMERYAQVRGVSCALAEPLSPEDAQVQPVAFVSPTKWHLAHTTWFFETFLLLPHLAGYKPLDPAYSTLYNSYYNSVGAQFPQAKRGLISRPTLGQVLKYRRHVDQAMESLWREASEEAKAKLQELVEIGLHHEQQHQELLLMDIKYVLSCNPLFPAYQPPKPAAAPTEGRPMAWLTVKEGVYSIGHQSPGFAYDNEGPAHPEYVHATQIADRLVTAKEYLEFIEDGGYSSPQVWLSDGWATVKQEGWQAPLYWVKESGMWHQFTLSGLMPLELDAPVCHVSYYEAEAFATWRGARLPRENEWEVAAREGGVAGENFQESGRFRPSPALGHRGMRQVGGEVWEWTMSPYVAYPGYRAASGALGEYNGKFMCNSMVLRGSSCLTPRAHGRVTYRNFFSPEARWQFGGIRLAKDL